MAVPPASDAASPQPQPPLLRALAGLGRRFLDAAAGSVRIVGLLGGTLIMLLMGGPDSRRISLKAVLRRITDFGPLAFWLTIQISFSIGIIFGILLETSLQWADLLEIAIGKAVGVLVEQVAPLFVAIMVAARNGAALAADFSTMVATREIDALHSIGLSPERLLVAPAVLGAVAAVPLLTILMITCILLTFSVYLEWKQVSSVLLVLSIAVNAIEPAALLIALGKGALFGALIVAIAAGRGLASQPSVRAVGSSVTGALVAMISTVLLLNAALTLLL